MSHHARMNPEAEQASGDGARPGPFVGSFSDARGGAGVSDLVTQLKVEATHWDHDDAVANLLLTAAEQITRLRDGLEVLASPNRSVRATGMDARDMAAFAQGVLDVANSGLVESPQNA